VRAQPQPPDLLGALDLAEPGQPLVEVRRRAEPGRQRLVLLDAQWPGPGHLAGAGSTPVELGDRRGDRRGLPSDDGLGGQPAGQRDVVVVLHEQGVRLAGCHDDGRLGGHRPSGQPLHAGPGPVGAPDQQVPAAGRGEKPGDGVVPRGHLGAGEAGKLVGQQRNRLHMIRLASVAWCG
jgi:hypothetical protein